MNNPGNPNRAARKLAHRCEYPRDRIAETYRFRVFPHGQVSLDPVLKMKWVLRLLLQIIFLSIE